jgi:biopolymer transport protein ExbD
MRAVPIFITALLGVQPVMADEAKVESLLRRIEVLEQKVATLSEQVAASQPREVTLPVPALAVRGAMIIDIQGDGLFRLEGKPLDDTEITKRLKAAAAQHPNQTVGIRVAENTDYRNTMRAMEILKKSGIQNVYFSSKESGEKKAEGGQPASRPESK